MLRCSIYKEVTFACWRHWQNAMRSIYCLFFKFKRHVGILYEPLLYYFLLQIRRVGDLCLSKGYQQLFLTTHRCVMRTRDINLCVIFL